MADDYPAPVYDSSEWARQEKLARRYADDRGVWNDAMGAGALFRKRDARSILRYTKKLREGGKR